MSASLVQCHRSGNPLNGRPTAAGWHRLNSSMPIGYTGSDFGEME